MKFPTDLCARCCRAISGYGWCGPCLGGFDDPPED